MNTHTMGRKSNELLAVTALLTIAAIGWYVFLLITIKGANTRVFELASRIETESAEESSLASKKVLIAQTLPLRDRLSSYIVRKDGAVSFIELLEATGGGIGVNVLIDAAQTRALPSSTEVEELRLTLTATGTWASVARFLGLLELLPYKTNITQLVVSKATSPTEGPWRADLSLTVLKEK